jgi:hypothetical protein
MQAIRSVRSFSATLFHDPDGHGIFVYHAGVNRLNPPWRLGSSSPGESRGDPPNAGGQTR